MLVWDKEDFFIFVEDVVQLCFERFEGVVQVSVCGVEFKEFCIEFDFDCLVVYCIDLCELQGVLCILNINVLGGYFWDGSW